MYYTWDGKCMQNFRRETSGETAGRRKHGCATMRALRAHNELDVTMWTVLMGLLGTEQLIF
jgi:hypothetical protein